MNLAVKFNDSYKETKGTDLAFAMYAAFNYGSNAFCFDQAKRLMSHANDSDSTPSQRILGL